MTEWVKSPVFETVTGIDAARKMLQTIPIDDCTLDVGAEVEVSFKGRGVRIAVEMVVSDTAFIGRIVGFDAGGEAYNGLSVGDMVRFQRQHIQRIH